jgi:ATP-dependent exoDNAse (exonuclease V) beta subunit
LLKQEEERKPDDQPIQHLGRVAERLRHQIATNEPLETGEPSNLQIATLWGAKGVTAEHVYILGVCKEALPGLRRDEYPGTDAQYVDEQRRLFYVSITRAKTTLVISRALGIGRNRAKQIGLVVTSGSKYWAKLQITLPSRDHRTVSGRRARRLLGRVPRGQTARGESGRALHQCNDRAHVNWSPPSAWAIGAAMLPRVRAAQTVLSRSYTPLGQVGARRQVGASIQRIPEPHRG